MTTDPLSDVLSLLRPRSHVSGGFDAGGRWAVQWPRTGGIKCYAVAAGRCWLVVDGVPDPVPLEAGDCFLLPGGGPFRLASDLHAAPLDAADVYAARRDGGVASCNGGGEFFLVGSYFALQGEGAGLLQQLLPPVVHIRQDAEKNALRWCVERMTQELRDRRPGTRLVVEHLAHMMLVQALRRLLEIDPAGSAPQRTGWLFALADRHIGAALGALHDDPAHSWTLHALAGRAGLSRSLFAARFKRLVGAAPMEYLARWRMALAADRLLAGREPAGAIALSLGYGSDSAFSTAFKRVMGCSPRQYGRTHGAAGVPPRAGSPNHQDALYAGSGTTTCETE